MVLLFTFKCLIRLEFSLVFGERYESRLVLFFYLATQESLQHLLVTGIGTPPSSCTKYIYILPTLFHWSVCSCASTIKFLIFKVLWMFLYLLTTSGFLYLGATVILSQRDFSAVEGCSVHHVMDSSIPGPTH